MNEKETVFMEERKQMILNLLQETEKVTVAYLSELFNVSGATIRSDLRDLENESFCSGPMAGQCGYPSRHLR